MERVVVPVKAMTVDRVSQQLPRTLDERVVGGRPTDKGWGFRYSSGTRTRPREPCPLEGDSSPC
jgi:hypothetical protein